MAGQGVTEIEIPEQGGDSPIARVSTGVTAFVGRTLKGPVNRPVRVRSFAEFRQIFGGLWQPSTLAYAVEQFFENGGRTAIVVRLVNGARPLSLTLPAGERTLRLVALNPGSREYVRASVDYDGIGESETTRFNLVVQRVRTPGSELIEDQEIFRRLSIGPTSARFVVEALRESRLVRVDGPVPLQRPDRTLGGPGGAMVGYVHANNDGDDGAALTDYDIIGSAVEHTGLFALRPGIAFDLLCIPPLSREQDIGLSALLVAARFCRERHVMLVVDPPAAWRTPQAALEGMRAWPFRSENAVMYFPRILAFDRLRGREEIFGSAGVAAALIARSEENCPLWTARQREEAILRPGLRPAVEVEEPDRARLAHAGINTLLAVRSSARPATTGRTLAVGTPAAAHWGELPARRLAMFILSSIERGTRWLQFQHNSPTARACAQVQVEDFLAALQREGVLAETDSYFVICDERVNSPETVAAGRVNLLFGFAIGEPGDFHTCMVTHQAGSSRVRPVTVNRQSTAPGRLAWEIETTILRGIVHPQ